MNKKIISITIIAIIIIIAGGTAYKVNKSHKDKLMYVSELYIIEHTKLCYNEKKCTTDVVTLKNLYDLSYLKNEVNPVTKEYYNENSYIKKEENNYSFVIVN